mgnify:CR=1 FL=1
MAKRPSNDVKPERVFKELEEGKIVIVAGFQGLMKNGDVATLGRGGSDATAVALAGAMHADMCEIFTDVDGVYSADPRVVKNAHKMKEITNTEMLEMARLRWRHAASQRRTRDQISHPDPCQIHIYE